MTDPTPLLRLAWEVQPESDRGECLLVVDVHPGRMDAPGRQVAVYLLGQVAKANEPLCMLLDRIAEIDQPMASAMRCASEHANAGRAVSLKHAAQHATSLAAEDWRVVVELRDAEGRTVEVRTTSEGGGV